MIPVHFVAQSLLSFNSATQSLTILSLSPRYLEPSVEDDMLKNVV